jgi:hypothetical protein
MRIGMLTSLHFCLAGQLSRKGDATRLPVLALFGHGAMSGLSPLSGVKQKLDFGAVRAAFDPTGTLAAKFSYGRRVRMR